MQRKVYCACDSNFTNFYKSQAGSGFSDISIYRGFPYQRGYGIGTLIRRFGIPILKMFGKHALKTGVNMGQDILDKKRNIKQVLITRAKQGLKEAAKESLSKTSDYIEQKGSGVKRKKSYKKKLSNKKRRTKKDIFD